MKRILVVLLALSLVLSAFSTALASKANDTFIYGIDGDLGNDVNTITTSSRYDLTVERLIYSPLFNYYGPDDIEYRLGEAEELIIEEEEHTNAFSAEIIWIVLWFAEDILIYDRGDLL